MDEILLIDEAMREAAAQFVPDMTGIATVQGHPDLVEVESPTAPIRVHRWPTGTARPLVEFTARLRTTLAAGIPDLVAAPVATGEPPQWFIEIAGRFYDADRWIPSPQSVRRRTALVQGHAVHLPPPGGAVAPPESIAHALARWHLAAEPLLSGTAVPEAPLRAVFDTIFERWRIDRNRLRPLTAEQPWAQRWLRYSEQVIARAEEALAPVSFLVTAPPVIAHLAVWPGHLLIERGEVRAILDPAHAAKSSPLMDIAAAITHTGRWSADAAERALGGYAAVRRLSPDERRMLPVVASIDLVAESGRLLWLAFGAETEPGSLVATQARSGAETLIASLEAIVPAVGRAGEAIAPPKRRWEHRPHRPAGPRPPTGAKRKSPPTH